MMEHYYHVAVAHQHVCEPASHLSSRTLPPPRHTTTQQQASKGQKPRDDGVILFYFHDLTFPEALLRPLRMHRKKQGSSSNFRPSSTTSATPLHR